MGTWGTGPFDSDDALDWVWELQEAPDWSMVDSALRTAADTAPDVDLEAPAGQVAWAAATVVTAAAHPGVAVPDEVAPWLDRHRGACPAELRSLASRALERVLADRSELVALWNEAGNDDWLTDVQRLVSQLG
jgi:hypothetical protein